MEFWLQPRLKKALLKEKQRSNLQDDKEQMKKEFEEKVRRGHVSMDDIQYYKGLLENGSR